MLDGHWRSPIDQGLKPIGRGLHRAGVTPDLVTIIGIIMATATAVVAGMGHFRVALLLLVLTGIPDALDGAVAKAAGSSTNRGAFFDSVTDRLTDALLFGGIAWYYAGTDTPRLALLPVAIMATAFLISYQRAKAESLGIDAKGGLMERAERFVVLMFGFLFNELLTAVLWVMLVLTIFTAAQRFTKVWRLADRPPRRERLRRRRQARPRERLRSYSRRAGRGCSTRHFRIVSAPRSPRACPARPRVHWRRPAARRSV